MTNLPTVTEEHRHRRVEPLVQLLVMVLTTAVGAIVTYILFRDHDTETGFLGLIGSLVIIGFVSLVVYFVWPRGKPAG